jgi:hypothetical protein
MPTYWVSGMAAHYDSKATKPKTKETAKNGILSRNTLGRGEGYSSKNAF